jgi:hypothetical protein
MKISIDSINDISTRDSQKRKVYSLDDDLQEYIRYAKPSLFKLTRGLHIDGAGVKQIALNVLEDFGITDCKIYTSKTFNSYEYMGDIYFHPTVFTSFNIEIVLHEIVHVFQERLTCMACSAHGEVFVTLLRYLLNHYEIVNNEKFDELNSGKVKYFHDLDFSFKEVTRESFNFKKEEGRNRGLRTWGATKEGVNTEIVYCDTDNYFYEYIRFDSGLNKYFEIKTAKFRNLMCIGQSIQMSEDLKIIKNDKKRYTLEKTNNGVIVKESYGSLGKILKKIDVKYIS